MNVKKFIALNTGIKIPSVGLGVFKIPDGMKTKETVKTALKLGYRLIDTASFYGNEADVGRAIKESKIPRREIFVTTKLYPLRITNIKKAFYESLRKLGLEYIDLYLIHWPFLRTRKIWEELESLYLEGKVKAIGVSNFNIEHLEKLLKTAKIVPAVNQVEFHPFLYRRELLDYCKSKSIKLEAHSPLAHGKMTQDLTINKIAKKYKKSNAQIMLRWALQHGTVVIPKATKESHLRENFNVFNFKIKEDDMNILDDLNANYHSAFLSRLVK